MDFFGSGNTHEYPPYVSTLGYHYCRLTIEQKGLIVILRYVRVRLIKSVDLNFGFVFQGIFPTIAKNVENNDSKRVEY